MKIDYQACSRMAKEIGVSPYIVVKRAVNYRAAENISKRECCEYCEYCVSVQFGSVEVDECETIGIAKDRGAVINKARVCDAFKKTVKR